MAHTLRGVATVSMWADDHAGAVRWYSELLAETPYFERPGYAEFRIGDHGTELGIIDNSYALHLAHPDMASGVVVYWQVDDVEILFETLRTMGAVQLEAPKDRGRGFITATVVDPFGNILGIMQNPHYATMHKSASESAICITSSPV